jgi:hypothetical protein
MVSQLKVNEIIKQSGSSITIGESGTTVNIPSGATITNSGTATGFGGDNTPSFGAKLSSNQSLSASTQTKMELATELWDTDSAFDSSTNYRFTVPSGKAGKYMFIGSGNIGAMSDNADIRMTFYKNGSSSNQGNIRYYAGGAGVGIYFTSSAVIDLAVGDYVELYQFASSGNHFDSGMTYFYGFKLLGV